MTDWETLSSEVVYETAWIKVHKDKVKTHDNEETTYSYMALHAPTVQIVPVDSQKRILLQQVYRYPIKQTLWEIPCGHSDGEDLLQAAKRELLEETGLGSDKWTELSTVAVCSGVANISSVFFLVEDVQVISDDRDEHEAIGEQRFFTVTEIKEMIQRGEIVDAETLVGLYQSMEKLEEENDVQPK